MSEEQDILNRWTEYCSDLYNHPTVKDLKQYRLNCPNAAQEDPSQILREEVQVAVKAPNKGKSPGVDNILVAKLVQAGGDYAIDPLTTVCNKIWKTGVCPTPWTQSLVFTFTKKGDLQQSQNNQKITAYLKCVMMRNVA